MKIKVSEFQKYLEQQGMTKEAFAAHIGVNVSEVDKMLSGGAVGINTARKFINSVSADIAQGLIDWDAIGAKNPL